MNNQHTNNNNHSNTNNQNQISNLPEINEKQNDLSLNHTIKLTDKELRESFDKSYLNYYLENINVNKYREFSKEVCQKTNNGTAYEKLLSDFDYDKLRKEIKNLEYSHIKNHLTYHDRIVKKEIIDVTDDYRPATYTSRLAVIIRRLPALTAKAKAAAYASEVGESFRPIVPRSFVNFLYFVSIGYVVMDISGRTYCVKDQGQEKMMYFALDTTLFHLMASLVFPAVVIHKIVSLASKGCKKLFPTFIKGHAWLPALIALSSVPFIIDPIDHVTEFILDKGIRPFYIEKIAKEAHKLH